MLLTASCGSICLSFFTHILCSLLSRNWPNICCCCLELSMRLRCINTKHLPSANSTPCVPFSNCLPIFWTAYNNLLGWPACGAAATPDDADVAAGGASIIPVPFILVLQRAHTYSRKRNGATGNIIIWGTAIIRRWSSWRFVMHPLTRSRQQLYAVLFEAYAVAFLPLDYHPFLVHVVRGSGKHSLPFCTMHPNEIVYHLGPLGKKVLQCGICASGLRNRTSVCPHRYNNEQCRWRE